MSNEEYPGSPLLTSKQNEAAELINSDARNILLYGGARSGKTILFIWKLILRSMKYPGSRHLAARLRFSHAKTSLWHESLLLALKDIQKKHYILNRSDYYITFSNGSEIWIGGFDDKERIEKILGHEYATIYFNEISQMGYEIILMGLPRLAQKIIGLKNRAYYDCNPPSPLHWAHKLFIEKVDPKTGERLKRPELYASMLINPIDNQDNLAENYIENFLETLPDRARRRFLNGEWVKSEGTIYDFFSEEMYTPYDDLPPMEYHSIGVDGGLNMAAILWGWAGDHLYLVDDHGTYNATTSTFNSQIDALWNSDIKPNTPRYCDPSMGERIQEITNGEPANNSVDDGIDFLNTKMEHGLFHYTEKAIGFLSEVWDYRRDDKERVIKINDHFMDAGRYGAYSFSKPGRIGKQETHSKPLTAGMRTMKF